MYYDVWDLTGQYVVFMGVLLMATQWRNLNDFTDGNIEGIDE